MGEDMCRSFECDFAKKFTNTTQREVADKLSKINPLLENAVSGITSSVEKWESFKQAIHQCYQFISDQNCYSSLYNTQLISESHVSDHLAQVKKLIETLESKNSLLEDALICSDSLKQNVTGNILDEVNHEESILKEKWDQLSKYLVDSFDLLLTVKTTWAEFEEEINALDCWISETEIELACLQTDRPCMFPKLDNICKEIQPKIEKWNILKNVGSKLSLNSCLEVLASDKIRSKLRSTDDQLKSLERNLNCCSRHILHLHKEKERNEKIIQEAETFFTDVQKNWKEILIDDKEELEDELFFIGVLHENIICHQASIQQIKRNTIFCPTIDFSFANRISEISCSSQKVMQMVTSRYIKLMDSYCQKGSLFEKIKLIFKFFQKYKSFQTDLLTSENKDTYLKSLEIYMKYRLYDLYLHCHRNLLRCVVKECFIEDKYTEKFLDFAKLIKKSWDAFEHLHVVNSIKRKEIVQLWENYWYYFYQARSYIHNLQRRASRYPRVVVTGQINSEMLKVEELMTCVDIVKKSIHDAETAAKALMPILSPSNTQFIDCVSHLKEFSEEQELLIHKEFLGLQNAFSIFREVDFSLKNSKQGLTNVLMDKMEKSDCELDKEVEKQDHIGVIKTSSSLLSEVDENLSALKSTVSFPTYIDDVLMQKRLSSTLLYYLEECPNSALYKSDKKNFKEFSSLFVDWCDQTEIKIKSKYFGSLENIKAELTGVIGKEMQLQLQLFNLIQSFAKILRPYDKEFRISTQVDVVGRYWDSVNEVFMNRIQDIGELIKKKTLINKGLAGPRQSCNALEIILKAPLKLKEVSEAEIKSKLIPTEELLLKINELSNKVNYLSNDMSNLMNDPDAFSCNFEKDMYSRSLQLLCQKYELLKALSLEREKYLNRIWSSWDNILNQLRSLEDWLSTREQILLKTNYFEQNLSRNMYLKGVKTYENLNHDIQDNVHLLHNVNAAFHNISRKDLDVDDSLKNNVVTVNSRWHKLYENVSNTLESIKNVLQMWDSYDKLKEHLLLLLTETDLKLTTLEQSDAFSQEEFIVIMKEIYLHEEELLKFVSLASHLKVTSHCSESEINSDVQNVKTYWDEILKRLSKFKGNMKSNDEVSAKEKEDNDSSETIQEIKKVASQEVYQATCEEGSSVLETADVSDDPGHKEYVKDLLAALEEAEERIDSLEVVLSEPTPTEIDDSNGPNYSRLLAACRSSIDVIQHLNHVLSENPYLGDSDFIKNRTEGMINRWEKIENATLDKELRAMKRFEKWQQFSLELKNLEKWLLDSLQVQATQTVSGATMDNFIAMIQKHQMLISEISGYKKSILSLNATGHKISFGLNCKDNADSLKEKLKAVNEHWDKLCLVAMDWQKKLQTEFLDSEDLNKTLLEMELWLQESRERLLAVPLTYEKDDNRIYDLHTEVFALKQQLESCTQQVQLLLTVSDQLFEDETIDEENALDSRYVKIEYTLRSILKNSEDLIVEASERLSILSKYLLNNGVSPLVEEESALELRGEPTQIRRCCQYLIRVARASIPLQAILLLLLGAAFLIPRDEEEVSCRLSNNFASSLSTMLRYPDGPPPV